MNKFKYIRILNNKQIRYLSKEYKDNLHIVFLHGFMSNIEGEKPQAILKFAKKISLASFLSNILVMENPQENLSRGISLNGQKKLKP